MKKFLSLVAFAILSFTSAFAAENKMADLTVNVSDARNDKGVVRIAMYNAKDAYAADKTNTGDGAFRKVTAEIKGGKATSVFKEVPYGDYAIKIFHDEDNSGKFYTGAFGIPQVEYAFSNNAKGLMGPASFEKAKFTVGSTEAVMNVSFKGKQ